MYNLTKKKQVYLTVFLCFHCYTVGGASTHLFQETQVKKKPKQHGSTCNRTQSSDMNIQNCVKLWNKMWTNDDVIMTVKL